jgi:hypothetical protein
MEAASPSKSFVTVSVTMITTILTVYSTITFQSKHLAIFITGPCHLRNISGMNFIVVSAASCRRIGNESFAAVQRWGRRDVFEIVPEKRVIVDLAIQRSRSWFTRCYMGELRRYTMGIARLSHAGLGRLFRLPGSRYSNHRQSRLFHRALSLLRSGSSLNKR